MLAFTVENVSVTVSSIRLVSFTAVTVTAFVVFQLVVVKSISAVAPAFTVTAVLPLTTRTLTPPEGCVRSFTLYVPAVPCSVRLSAVDGSTSIAGVSIGTHAE